MTFAMTRALSTLLILTGLSLSGCTHAPVRPDVNTSVASIRMYASSFDGMSPDQAREKLDGGMLSLGEWSEGEVGGLELVATFPDHEIRVLFFEDVAITASVQILSE